MHTPSAFISYAGEEDEHMLWVRELGARLRGDGIETILDQWHAVPGDQLPAFMEKALRNNDIVLIICTPEYKRKSDGRLGGVGYEGDIITAEVMTSQNHRKFIPILRASEWTDSAPSWLLGKYHIDLRGASYSEANYRTVLETLLGIPVLAPPIGGTNSTKPPVSTNVNSPHFAIRIQVIDRLSYSGDRHAARKKLLKATDG